MQLLRKTTTKLQNHYLDSQTIKQKENKAPLYFTRRTIERPKDYNVNSKILSLQNVGDIAVKVNLKIEVGNINNKSLNEQCHKSDTSKERLIYMLLCACKWTWMMLAKTQYQMVDHGFNIYLVRPIIVIQVATSNTHYIGYLAHVTMINEHLLR